MSRRPNTKRLSPPNPKALARLAKLEGQQVSVALDDGSRIDDCQLAGVTRRSRPQGAPD